MLIRLARQGDIGFGQLVEKESHGRNLLVVSHPKNGSITVMDAHCFHMGTPLVGGDIEDLDGHACVVCPAHRYRIDSHTGRQIESDLCGNRCSSTDQKQRIYNVHCDGDYIWVDIPEVAASQLPSDVYNHPRPVSPVVSSQNYGLFGPAPPHMNPTTTTAINSSNTLPVSPLQPYAGINAYPIVPGQPSPMKSQRPSSSVADEPPLILSQEMQQSTPTVEHQQSVPQHQKGRIQFPSMKTDAPHITRRKAATAAILAKSYQPPIITTKVLSSVEPLEQQQQAPVQKTLFQTWGMPQVAVGPRVEERMAMD